MLGEQDFYLPHKSASVRTVISPRVILLDPDGNFPLVLTKGLRGLPGGKGKLSEIADQNLLGIGSFPTIAREVEEETERDVSAYLSKASACVGLAEITGVDAVAHVVTEILTPIFICRVPHMTYPNTVTIANLHEHQPGPLYPDARLAIHHVQRRIRERQTGFILPEFLNEGRKIYFQLAPVRGLISRIPWVD